MPFNERQFGGGRQAEEENELSPQEAEAASAQLFMDLLGGEVHKNGTLLPTAIYPSRVQPKVKVHFGVFSRFESTEQESEYQMLLHSVSVKRRILAFAVAIGVLLPSCFDTTWKFPELSAFSASMVAMLMVATVSIGVATEALSIPFLRKHVHEGLIKAERSPARLGETLPRALATSSERAEQLRRMDPEPAFYDSNEITHVLVVMTYLILQVILDAFTGKSTYVEDDLLALLATSILVLQAPTSMFICCVTTVLTYLMFNFGSLYSNFTQVVANAHNADYNFTGSVVDASLNGHNMFCVARRVIGSDLNLLCTLNSESPGLAESLWNLFEPRWRGLFFLLSGSCICVFISIRRNAQSRRFYALCKAKSQLLIERAQEATRARQEERAAQAFMRPEPTPNRTERPPSPLYNANKTALSPVRDAPAADLRQRRREEPVRSDSFGPLKQPVVRGGDGGAGTGARRGGGAGGTFAIGRFPPAELHDRPVRPANHRLSDRAKAATTVPQMADVTSPPETNYRQQREDLQRRIQMLGEAGAAQHPHKGGRLSVGGDSVARRSASPPSRPGSPPRRKTIGVGRRDVPNFQVIVSPPSNDKEQRAYNEEVRRARANREGVPPTRLDFDRDEGRREEESEERVVGGRRTVEIVGSGRRRPREEEEEPSKGTARRRRKK